MAKLYNLARMTTATTGTGTITLGSAATSYLSFADAGVQNGETVTYAIVDGSNREVGRGVYTSSGTTLTRATILESTNSNNAINLSGSAEVFITAAAEDIANVGETNTFTSSQVISVTDNSNAALRVTQLGTGDALLIEDSTNPDSSPLVVNASGSVIAGHTSNLDSTKLQVAGSSQASSTLSQFNYSALATPASHRFYKSGTSTIGSHALVAADDGLGTIAFYGSDGTSFISGATISVNVDGTPGTNDMPGRIVFSTTGDGASLPSEKLRIGSAGQIGIIGGNYGTTGQVLTSGGSSAAPTWQTIANTQVSGLGTMATQNSNNVSITGGSITGITDLAVADGGTGASDASGARTNLGLGTIATQAANNVSITGGSVTGITDITVADGGTGVSSFTAYSLIAGGTTSTGALQSISGLGTSGQVLTSNGAGALPTWQAAASSSMTLLGTITTTSGTTQSLSGLTLTGYNFLVLFVNGVSSTTAGDDLSIVDGASNSFLLFNDSNSAANVWNGTAWINLNNGSIGAWGQSNGTTTYNTNPSSQASGTAGAKLAFGRINQTTASTSIGVSVQTGFDAGTVTVYGVK